MSSKQESKVNVESEAPVAEDSTNTHELLDTSINEESNVSDDTITSGYIKPKMKKVFYKQEEISYEDLEKVINEKTDNLNPEKISADNITFIKDVLAKSKKETEDGIKIFTAWTYAPKNPDITKQVIGKDGCYLKKTTENYGLYFMWHNREDNKIYAYGPKYRKPSEIEAKTKVPEGRDVQVLVGALDFIRYRSMQLRFRYQQ
jgi:hypothetical protein